MKAYTFYEKIIIDSITLEAYDIEKGSDFENINNVYDIFIKEYGFMINRIGSVNAFQEWLQGLPSVLTVPFYNSDILDIAYIHDKLPAGASESNEDNFLKFYFPNLANAFFTLKDNL